MMETIRIRRAGYPIRHSYPDFVDRYRILIDGIKPSHKEDCRVASAKICQAVLGTADYQLGKTKVFLKDAQDLYLEQLREQALARKILILQKCIRGWAQRRKFIKYKASALIIQTKWRGYIQHKNYNKVKTTFNLLFLRYSIVHLFLLIKDETRLYANASNVPSTSSYSSLQYIEKQNY